MRRDDRGVAALEFALVFSFVVFPLLLGVIQYGYQYWALETASAAAREAARHLAVGADPCLVAAEARGRADNPALGNVSVTYSSPYTSVATTPARGQLVTVTVSFDSLDLNLLPVPDGGHITQSAQARVQSQHAGTATDQFIDLSGNVEPGAATLHWPSCGAAPAAP